MTTLTLTAAGREHARTLFPGVLAQTDGPRTPLLTWFAVAFAVLVAINSTGWLPGVVAKGGSEVSRWCLVAAISAIGMKTQLKELAAVGLKPVVLMFGETLFLAALVLALLRWGF